MTWKMRLLGGLVAVSMLFAGCAQGVDDETFEAGVTNAQLESPVLSEDSFGVVTDVVTGNEVIQVTWPVVVGAEGYKLSATKTGRWTQGALQPVTPEPVMFGESTEKEVEGCSTTFPAEYGCEYEVTILTIGNKKLNNKDAEEATLYKYLYYTPPVMIPAVDKNGNPTALDKVIPTYFDPARPKSRAVFLLEPEATYYINGDLSFAYHEVQIYPAVWNEAKGDYDEVATHATVVFGADEEAGTEGAIYTATGLTLRSLNIDCSKMKADGLILMESKLTDVPLAPAGGLMYCDKPIAIQSCWIKELKSSIFNVNTGAWGIKEFRLEDSIVQLYFDGATEKHTFINAHCAGVGLVNGVKEASWYGGILNTYILNSTIFNRCKGSDMSNKNYFIRFSNKDLSKVFNTYEGVFDLKNCTVSRMVTKKDFANNMPNKTPWVYTFENSVFYDVYRLQKIKQGGTNASKKETNTTWGVTNSVDNTDKNEFATVEDPGFTDANLNAILDFSKPNGGVNFKATGTISSTIGDPRWLK